MASGSCSVRTAHAPGTRLRAVTSEYQRSLKTVKVSGTSDGVVRLTLARASRRNAVNQQMARDIAEAVSLATEWGARVGVIDAEGPAFCAGADLSELETGSRTLEDIIESLTGSTIHWTAAVHGAARGGALSILSACPRVVATQGATFGFPELSRGFFPSDVIGRQEQLLGSRRAFELAFSAEAIDAQEAKILGLVSVVVANDLLEEWIQAQASRMSAFDASALRSGVNLWNARVRQTITPAPAHLTN
jgi:enoyl-CoA hydratase/carnithine racemase